MTRGADDTDERFRALFSDNARAVLAYALRRVSQPADAADVVAETFLVAWRRFDHVPPGGGSRLWLFGVARRTLANQRRGHLRRSRLGDRLREELTGMVGHERFSEGACVVRMAIARLSAEDRELLWLTSWEGLSPTEIAVVLALPPGTVRSRLHRARARLRVELESLGWSDRPSDGGHVWPTSKRSSRTRSER